MSDIDEILELFGSSSGGKDTLDIIRTPPSPIVRMQEEREKHYGTNRYFELPREPLFGANRHPVQAQFTNTRRCGAGGCEPRGLEAMAERSVEDHDFFDLVGARDMVVRQGSVEGETRMERIQREINQGAKKFKKEQKAMLEGDDAKQLGANRIRINNRIVLEARQDIIATAVSVVNKGGDMGSDAFWVIDNIVPFKVSERLGPKGVVRTDRELTRVINRIKSDIKKLEKGELKRGRNIVRKKTYGDFTLLFWPEKVQHQKVDTVEEIVLQPKGKTKSFSYFQNFDIPPPPLKSKVNPWALKKGGKMMNIKDILEKYDADFSLKSLVDRDLRTAARDKLFETLVQIKGITEDEIIEESEVRNVGPHKGDFVREKVKELQENGEIAVIKDEAGHIMVSDYLANDDPYKRLLVIAYQISRVDPLVHTKDTLYSVSNVEEISADVKRQILTKMREEISAELVKAGIVKNGVVLRDMQKVPLIKNGKPVVKNGKPVMTRYPINVNVRKYNDIQRRIENTYRNLYPLAFRAQEDYKEANREILEYLGSGLGNVGDAVLAELKKQPIGMNYKLVQNKVKAGIIKNGIILDPTQEVEVIRDGKPVMTKYPIEVNIRKYAEINKYIDNVYAAKVYSGAPAEHVPVLVSKGLVDHLHTVPGHVSHTILSELEKYPLDANYPYIQRYGLGAVNNLGMPVIDHSGLETGVFNTIWKVVEENIFSESDLREFFIGPEQERISKEQWDVIDQEWLIYKEQHSEPRDYDGMFDELEPQNEEELAMTRGTLKSEIASLESGIHEDNRQVEGYVINVSKILAILDMDVANNIRNRINSGAVSIANMHLLSTEELLPELFLNDELRAGSPRKDYIDILEKEFDSLEITLDGSADQFTNWLNNQILMTANDLLHYYRPYDATVWFETSHNAFNADKYKVSEKDLCDAMNKYYVMTKSGIQCMTADNIRKNLSELKKYNRKDLEKLIK